MKARAVAVLLCVGIIGGCAMYKLPTQESASADDYAMARSVKCDNAAACDRSWKKAKVWIIESSGWKIRSADDVMIETYGPTLDAARWAFIAVRRANDDGTETITLTPRCAWGETMLCVPFGGNPTLARADFARAIK